MNGSSVRAPAAVALAIAICACTGRSAVDLNPEPANAVADTVPRPREARTSAIPPAGRFYAGRDYGSEAQFNPISVVVNEGWDMLRLSDDRAAFDRPYRVGAQAIFHSITSPGAVVSHFGVNRWLTREILPFSDKSNGGGQWLPNYHLHLFGSGMTYIRTAEWYEQHGVGHPRLAAAATLFAGHFMNEVIENGPYCCENEDSMTDLLIFDPAGMLLWNQEWMQRAFSGRVEMTNWYGQPVLRVPDNRIENSYSMFMVRAPLPRTDNWKVITTGGNAFLLGLSHRAGGLWFSASGGVVPVNNPVIESSTNMKTVDVKPNIGLFVDRDGSLLASFISVSGETNGATLNVYPGALWSSSMMPGFFVQQATGGADGRGLRFGIASRMGVGIGGFAR